MKAAEVDWTAFPWPKNERPAQASTHGVTSTLLESVTAWSVMGSPFGRKEAGSSHGAAATERVIWCHWYVDT